MSYDVTVNGKTTNVSSYAAATSTVKSAAAAASHELRKPLRPGLLRSFKATNRANADRLRSADTLAAGIKLPKASGDVSGRVGGLSYAIARR